MLVPAQVEKRNLQSLIAQGAPKDLIEAAKGPNRRSGLLAPTMVISAHQGEVYTCEFSPDGRQVLSAGMDRAVLVYSVYGECENLRRFRGHQKAVLEAHWSADGQTIYSCSADHTMIAWDVQEDKRIRCFGGLNTKGAHTEAVLSCQVNRRGSPLAVTGGDDGCVKVWDLRSRKMALEFEHRYQITAVTFDDSAERVFAGTLDHQILSFDMRAGCLEESLRGHDNSITGIDVSKCGSFLLSNGMDSAVRLWDIRPFVSSAAATSDKRLITRYHGGAKHTFERNLLRVRWSPDDQFFGLGSADRQAYVWKNPKTPESCHIVYQLPGHSGSVNEVQFHPKEPVIASAGSDAKVFLGELEE
ncbi:MAG: hypothetical protein KVP17_004472 [Porospora cf. gigantea B]|uniref:uncharacterized protein n=1 Tax=Porospora cf. gigantea B TaxID=2853592 RepID=UPI003571F6E0|nr:MAG: hypothetical protein KVP17_004472 [Porospora cf. gigantea B]